MTGDSSGSGGKVKVVKPAIFVPPGNQGGGLESSGAMPAVTVWLWSGDWQVEGRSEGRCPAGTCRLCESQLRPYKTLCGPRQAWGQNQGGVLGAKEGPVALVRGCVRRGSRG